MYTTIEIKAGKSMTQARLIGAKITRLSKWISGISSFRAIRTGVITPAMTKKNPVQY